MATDTDKNSTANTDEEESTPQLTHPPTPRVASDEEISIDGRRKKSFEYTQSFLLGKRIKATLSDGRTLVGKFICIDRLKNLILTDVIEERFVDPSDYKYRVSDGNEKSDGDKDEDSDGDISMNRHIRVERRISQAMIPGSRLVKAEISQSL